ncbi:MAG: alpha/beta hydrolase [Chitinophagales bacterium]|nr:alpha/beta hydrolase [Chitinophagales bacterium]
MEAKTFNWHQDETKLFGQYWKNDSAKAIVAIVHGMGEHSGRYADFVVPQLFAAGYSVIAFDQFGHGLTEGKRGHCPNYEAVLNSVENLLSKSSEYLGSNLPTFLYGHSMGGNVVSNYLLTKESHVKGAIISSPMYRLAFDPPAWKLIAGKLMRNIYPAFQERTGLDASAISRDRAAVEKYINDPLVHDKITVNFSLPFFEAGEYAIENAKAMKVPALLIHGTKDALTDYKGSEDFAQNAGKEVSLKLYMDGYHELHNEPNKEAVLADVITWLDKQV